MRIRVVYVKMKVHFTVCHNPDTSFAINTHEVLNEIHIPLLNSLPE
jgi:hypothetical protein